MAGSDSVNWEGRGLAERVWIHMEDANAGSNTVPNVISRELGLQSLLNRCGRARAESYLSGNISNPAAPSACEHSKPGQNLRHL